MMRAKISVLGLLVAGLSLSVHAQQPAPKSGILLLAHGGAAQWNERVNAVAATADQSQPTEVAFGMASRASIQGAIDKLAARGVTEIVAVPLFVSSHSSVITSTEYLLGLRPEAPKDLAIFAKMNHASHGAPAAVDHSAHGAPAVDPASPVTTTLKIRMTPALNRHPLIGAIVADRAKVDQQGAGEGSRHPRGSRPCAGRGQSPVARGHGRSCAANASLGAICVRRLHDGAGRCRSGDA